MWISPWRPIFTSKLCLKKKTSFFVSVVFQAVADLYLYFVVLSVPKMLSLLAHSLLKQWAELTVDWLERDLNPNAVSVLVQKERKKKTKQNRGMCALLQETGNFTSVNLVRLWHLNFTTFSLSRGFNTVCMKIWVHSNNYVFQMAFSFFYFYLSSPPKYMNHFIKERKKRRHSYSCIYLLKYGWTTKQYLSGFSKELQTIF